jgi:3-carboxy-cis,cis-muconate cycloisomerase
VTEDIRPRLLDPLFSTDGMRAAFSDASVLQGMLDFEAALAAAQGALGVIPVPAAQAIRQTCDARRFDITELARETREAGNVAIPLIKALTSLVARDAPSAAGYVHWGATSQDAIDSGLARQLRRALQQLEIDAATLVRALEELAERHGATPMIGRTWLQHAVPITFGLKAAGWLTAVDRARARVTRAGRDACVLQFGGAAGSLSAHGDHGMTLGRAVAAELELGFPDLPWHAHRDRLVELGAALGIFIGTLGKIARDVSLLMQTEVAEVAEPVRPGRGGSSTMPQKRNPVASAVALAAATRAPGLVATLLAAMPQEHERGLGGWHAEWATLPELFLLTSGSLHEMATAIADLGVDSDRMRQNLESGGGLAMAEQVTMALAPAIGREPAHRVVKAAGRRAIDEGRHLKEVLLQDAAVRTHLTADELDRLFLTDAHVKAAERLVRGILDSRNAHA